MTRGAEPLLNFVLLCCFLFVCMCLLQGVQADIH